MWFEVKTKYNKQGGEDKPTNETYLVLADDINQALKRFEENVDASVFPYIITLITLTSIIDVYPYSEEDETNK